MKKNIASLMALIMVGLGFALFMAGCSNEEEENFKKEVKVQIDLVEKEVKAIEQHQDNMRKMIAQMKVQLDSMQAELDKEAPRINTAKIAIKGLRDTTGRDKESALEYTASNPGWNFLYLMLFLLLLWVFYRLRVKSTRKANES